MLSTDVMKMEQENMELKNEVAALKKALGMEDNEERVCDNCEFFRRHYIRHSGRYVQIYEGHCIKGRLKDRKITDTCKLFEFRGENR